MRGSAVMMAWRAAAVIVVLASTVTPVNAAAQEREDERSGFCCTEVHPWYTSIELLGLQAIPWSVNRFIRQADFAKVSPATAWSNMKVGFEWDPNSFMTNQFMHPFHGNLYFNAGRNNGYTYWQSAMWAFAGSLFWEMAGETYPGAINDWVSTSVGGMAIGEATYRTAAYLRDNGATGAGRTFREIGATIVNPVAGFNRLIRGETGRIGENPEWSRPDFFLTHIDLGGRRVGEGNLGSGADNTTGFLRFGVTYGDPFRGAHERPFDSFTADLQVYFRDKGPLGALRVNGIVWGSALSDGDESRLFVIDQNYEYQNNLAFEYGGQSFGSSFMARFRPSPELDIDTKVGINGVLLGAVNSEYAPLAGREYDFVTGAGVRGELAARQDRFRVDIRYDGAFLHAVNGSESDHITHVLTARAHVRMFGGLGVGAMAGYFARSSRYAEFPNVTRENPEFRLFLTQIANPIR